MIRHISAFFALILALAMFTGTASAVDPPHAGPRIPQTFCSACHVVHGSPGAQLTTVNGNANLCISCHTTGGLANNKPLGSTMQATPGVSGTSHRWDGSMPVGSGPTNTYGLRPASSLSTTVLRNTLTTFGGVVVCSVCHNPHTQASAAWDMFAGPLAGLRGGDSGVATAASAATIIIDSSKATFWTPNVWRNYYVRIVKSGTVNNVGQVRVIASNTTNQLTLASAFPASIRLNDQYEIIGRHFQRTDDDINQMCEDCHYHWVQSHTRVAGDDAGYPADGVNVFSHPVGAALNADGKGHDRSAPLDVNGVPQSGTRFSKGGETPDNTSNNLMVDSAAAVRCLTCHKVHYTGYNSLYTE